MEENKTTSISLPMMQVNLTEKAAVLVRIGEAEGFISRYYSFDKSLTFICGPVDLTINQDTIDVEMAYDNALKQLVDWISSVELRARRVLEILSKD